MLWLGIPTSIPIGPPHALHTLTSTLNIRLSLFVGWPSVQHRPLRLPALRSGSSGPSAYTSAVADFIWWALSGVTLSR